MIGRRLADARSSERGAALILAIGFMLMIGAISVGLMAFITTSVRSRASLDAVRNRQYAADAGVENAIASVRANVNTIDSPSCATTYLTVAGVSPRIRVDCQKVPTSLLVQGVLVNQSNVIFSACLDTGSACTAVTTIVRAQVNFSRSASNGIDGTYIQSWSVNQ